VEAANSIGKIGDGSAAVPLINSIRNESLKLFIAYPDQKTIVPTEKDIQKTIEIRGGYGNYISFINAVAKALIKIGPSATYDLCQCLSDGSARIRGVVADVLRKVGTEDAVPYLKRALANNEEDFLILAVLALGFDRIAKGNVYNTMMQGSGSFWRSETAILVKEMDRGSYSRIESIEQGNTSDYLMKTLGEIKKYM
jgi:hypothetical protein